MTTPLTAKASIGIRKPVSEVYESIVDPELMQNYFISKSSGRMETGADLRWSFPEFEGGYPVSVKETVPDEKIIFVWDPESVVEILLEKNAEDYTVVRVSETGRNSDEAGIKWAIGQTEGRANFLACMKAFLESGIRLREGAFDFMKEK